MNELINVSRTDDLEFYRVVDTSPTSAIEVKGMSWGARGLHTWLITRGKKWRVYKRDLLNRSKEKEKALDRLLKELRRLGYLRVIQTRDKESSGIGWQWLINRQPIYKELNEKDGGIEYLNAEKQFAKSKKNTKSLSPPFVGDTVVGDTKGGDLSNNDASKNDLENKLKDPLVDEEIKTGSPPAPSEKPRIEKEHFNEAIDVTCETIDINQRLATNRKTAGAIIKQIVQGGYNEIRDFPFVLKVLYQGAKKKEFPFAWRFRERHWIGKKGGKPTAKAIYETWGNWYNGYCIQANELNHLKLTDQQIQVMCAMYGYEICNKVLTGMDTEKIVKEIEDGGSRRSHYEIVKDNVHIRHEDAKKELEEKRERGEEEPF